MIEGASAFMGVEEKELTSDAPSPAGDGEPEAPPREAARKGPGGRLAAALLSPSELFEDINRKPTFLAPVVIASLTAIGLVLFVNWRLKPDWKEFARSQIASQSDLMPGPQPTDRQIEFRVKIYRFLPAVAPVFTIVWYLVAAGVLALGLRAMRAKTTYEKVFSVFAWSDCSLRLVYTAIVMASMMMRDPATLGPAVLLNPGATVATNLSVALSQNASPALRVIASSVDIFSIWQIGLLVIGLAAIAGTPRITRAKTAAMVVGLFIVIILIRASLAALGSAVQ